MFIVMCKCACDALCASWSSWGAPNDVCCLFLLFFFVKLKRLNNLMKHLMFFFFDVVVMHLIPLFLLSTREIEFFCFFFSAQAPTT